MWLNNEISTDKRAVFIISLFNLVKEPILLLTALILYRYFSLFYLYNFNVQSRPPDYVDLDMPMQTLLRQDPL